MLVGAGTSAAPLFARLRNIEARAAAGNAPLRVLIIHHPLGTTKVAKCVQALTQFCGPRAGVFLS